VATACPVGLTSSGTVAVCSGRGRCLGLSGSCACTRGYIGAACGQCAINYTRRQDAGACIFAPGALASCDDNVQTANEEGVDCGGVCARPCADASVSVKPLLWNKMTVVGSLLGGGALAVVVALVILARKWKVRDDGPADAVEPDQPRGKKMSSVVPFASGGGSGGLGSVPEGGDDDMDSADEGTVNSGGKVDAVRGGGAAATVKDVISGAARRRRQSAVEHMAADDRQESSDDLVASVFRTALASPSVRQQEPFRGGRHGSVESPTTPRGSPLADKPLKPQSTSTPLTPRQQRQRAAGSASRHKSAANAATPTNARLQDAAGVAQSPASRDVPHSVVAVVTESARAAAQSPTAAMEPLWKREGAVATPSRGTLPRAFSGAGFASAVPVASPRLSSALAGGGGQRTGSSASNPRRQMTSVDAAGAYSSDDDNDDDDDDDDDDADFLAASTPRKAAASQSLAGKFTVASPTPVTPSRRAERVIAVGRAGDDAHGGMLDCDVGAGPSASSAVVEEWAPSPRGAAAAAGRASAAARTVGPAAPSTPTRFAPSAGRSRMRSPPVSSPSSGRASLAEFDRNRARVNIGE
jgi:hypothetical protein